MVATIIILATLLALVIGGAAGFIFGMTTQAKQTSNVIDSFVDTLTDAVLTKVRAFRQQEREEQDKQMEQAKHSAMEALDRLEKFQGAMVSGNPFNRVPLSFADLLARRRQEEPRKEEPNAVETMGDHFDELFNHDKSEESPAKEE
ncbi:MAG: hypothetical protein J6U54_18385 [Clostridiales bacterium]|nr:hypothetical protein [Clostridiales bacterium]